MAIGAAGPREEIFPQEIFIDSMNPVAVWGRFADGTEKKIFDRTIPIHFKGLDNTGRSLASASDADRLYKDFKIYAKFSRITSFVLSPDHRTILFSDDSSDSYPWSGLFDIRSGLAWFVARFAADSAAWAPDGRHLAIQKTMASGHGKIFILDPAQPLDVNRPWRGTQLEVSAKTLGLDESKYEKQSDGAITEIATNVANPRWTSSEELEFQVIRVKSASGSRVESEMGGAFESETWAYDLKTGKASRKKGRQ